MSNWNPNIGSGVQGTRKISAGAHWGVTQTVAVVNFEDGSVVESFRESVAPVSTLSATKLPSGVNLIRRRTLILNNQGGSTVYIGGTSGVNINSGYPISPNTEKAFEIAACLDVWCIGSGLDSEVRVLELA